jgi:hypothetical protein
VKQRGGGAARPGHARKGRRVGPGCRCHWERGRGPAPGGVEAGARHFESPSFYANRSVVGHWARYIRQMPARRQTRPYWVALSPRAGAQPLGGVEARVSLPVSEMFHVKHGVAGHWGRHRPRKPPAKAEAIVPACRLPRPVRARIRPAEQASAPSSLEGVSRETGRAGARCAPGTRNRGRNNSEMCTLLASPQALHRRPFTRVPAPRSGRPGSTRANSRRAPSSALAASANSALGFTRCARPPGAPNHS